MQPAVLPGSNNFSRLFWFQFFSDTHPAFLQIAFRKTEVNYVYHISVANDWKLRFSNNYIVLPSAAERKADENSKILLLPLNESYINRISNELVRNWKDVSVQLGLRQADIDRIEADYRDSCEKTYQALLFWRRKEGSRATVGLLVRVLENAGRRDVSEMLKSEYQLALLYLHSVQRASITVEIHSFFHCRVSCPN